MTDAAAAPPAVFINCPFDSAYKPTFDAIVFVIMSCGFAARSALELEDSGQTRIEKLYDLIAACQYGVHDLSRTELDPVHNLPRFNMPLELGVFLGARRFGDADQRRKRCLVLDRTQFRYQRFVSDLAGMDIKAHDGSPDQAMTQVRNWLATSTTRQLLGAAAVRAAYSRFRAELPALARAGGFGIDELPYVDYQRLLAAWLVGAEAKPKRSKRKKQT